MSFFDFDMEKPTPFSKTSLTLNVPRGTVSHQPSPISKRSSTSKTPHHHRRRACLVSSLKRRKSKSRSRSSSRKFIRRLSSCSTRRRKSMGLYEESRLPDSPVMKRRKSKPSRVCGDKDYNLIRVCFLGNTKCGKSSIISRYVDGIFDEVYHQTVLDMSSKKTTDDTNVEFDIWDIGGDGGVSEANDVRMTCIENSDVLVLCFSTVDYKSFLDIQTNWLPQLEFLLQKKRCILVGTKSDLREGLTRTEYVPRYEGVMLASDMGAVQYIETSASSGKNINDIFEAALRPADAIISRTEKLKLRIKRLSSVFRTKKKCRRV